MFCAAQQLHIDLDTLNDLEDPLLPWFEDLLARFPGISKVNFSASSLKSPQLRPFVEECKERNLQTYLCTNASLLREVNLVELASTKLDLLGFWLESLIPETQEKIRPGETLKMILDCFEQLKCAGASTSCCFYTHILEENQDEIMRILEYVKIQQRVDRIMLHLYGTETPDHVSRFRDIQEKFGGKPLTSDSPLLFERLKETAMKEKVLVNHFTQILFWNQTLQKVDQVDGKRQSKKARLVKLHEILKSVPCFQKQPVHYFWQGEPVYHCELQNPENLSFSHPSFDSVESRIDACSRDCHFKINQAHHSQIGRDEYALDQEKLRTRKIFAFRSR